ncbi:MAG: hypothetical protein HY754_03995 [Nitrospirae bacterium]|nr:hypothetical protein [Nitrospirota bacterium]
MEKYRFIRHVSMVVIILAAFTLAACGGGGGGDSSGTTSSSTTTSDTTTGGGTTNTTKTWTISTIDSQGYVGYYNSIAIDSNNKVHISYYDDTNDNLKYVTNSSGSWHGYLRYATNQ